MLFSFVIIVILELSPYTLPCFLSERLFELIENKSVKVVRRKYVVICDDITCSRHLFDLLSRLPAIHPFYCSNDRFSFASRAYRHFQGIRKIVRSALPVSLELLK